MTWDASHGKETCQMKRQTEREQVHRLAVKTLDQVLIARACEGLGCSMFEAQALSELIKDVYFPWLTQPEAIQAGQLDRFRLGEPGKVHVLDELAEGLRLEHRAT